MVLYPMACPTVAQQELEEMRIVTPRIIPQPINTFPTFSKNYFFLPGPFFIFT